MEDLATFETRAREEVIWVSVRATDGLTTTVMRFQDKGVRHAKAKAESSSDIDVLE